MSYLRWNNIKKIIGKQDSIVDLLAMPEAANIEFEPGKADSLTKDVEF